MAGAGANIAAVVSGTHNLNTAAPSNAVIIAYNRPVGNARITQRTANIDLTVSAGATTRLENRGGIAGVSYTNGANRGWVRLW